ncbi:unnamed protein product [Protopolystoma xenopodis]|uniref:Uncharacterized protein n=1 Tax=Protopolystoma xenopodis TaxID=117903 RepID=A0A3S5AHB0_9PLAT|nr:unnamed protein product [Protopolystoma xenopodis]
MVTELKRIALLEEGLDYEADLFRCETAPLASDSWPPSLNHLPLVNAREDAVALGEDDWPRTAPRQRSQTDVVARGMAQLSRARRLHPRLFSRLLRSKLTGGTSALANENDGSKKARDAFGLGSGEDPSSVKTFKLRDSQGTESRFRSRVRRTDATGIQLVPTEKEPAWMVVLYNNEFHNYDQVSELSIC